MPTDVLPVAAIGNDNFAAGSGIDRSAVAEKIDAGGCSATPFDFDRSGCADVDNQFTGAGVRRVDTFRSSCRSSPSRLECHFR